MKYPSFIQFYPTLRCNQDCRFCFNRNISSHTYKDMTKGDASALCKLLIDSGIPEVDILGGEPMLLPWMREFAGYVTDSGIRVNMSTNGSFPDMVDRFTDLDGELFSLGFSLHGFSGIHNALTESDNFSSAIRGIGKMIGSGRDPVVKSILLRENRNEIFGLVKYLAGLGVKRYCLLYEDTIGRRTPGAHFSFPEFHDIYSGLKSGVKRLLDVRFVAASGFHKYGAHIRRCAAGTEKVAILPDGSVFPCNLFAGFEEFRLGNIFADGVEKVMKNPILEVFKNRGGRNPCRTTACRNFFRCAGGCPAHSYFFGRTFDTGDPRCRPCVQKSLDKNHLFE